MQLENGTYPARPTGHVEVGDHANGCLIVTMEFALEGGQKISATYWLTTKDGAVNTKAITSLKEVFGWDGTDPFWLVDNGDTLVDVVVDLVVENETFQGNDGQEHTAPKVKWVNRAGGAGGAKIANSDRTALLAKYGAKLRAVSGGVAIPPKKATQKPSAPPTQPPAPAPAKKMHPPSDMNACWKAITDAMKDTPRAEVEAKWFEIIKAVHGDKPQPKYTPEDWGAIMTTMRTMFDNLPF